VTTTTTTTRTCPACGAPLVRRPKETKSNFDKRATCNLSCAKTLYHALAPKPEPGPERFCRRCGDPMTRRRGEGPTRFASRAYCSRECKVGHQPPRLDRRYEKPPTPPPAPAGAPAGRRRPTPGVPRALRARLQPQTALLIRASFGQHPDFVTAFQGEWNPSRVETAAIHSW